ncbi:MAG: hypothetical protein A2X49_02755 [Lentisphaerae bacterium GWF2_52_8]|nr:MAG: hypothetical protein A2X49_02755 [Lentisphaerae bacterium GWF2_52_8]
MKSLPKKLSLSGWGTEYRKLRRDGLREASYGGPLQRHLSENPSLKRFVFDNSAASLRLWNLLLSEEDRLHEARKKGTLIVACMKDLGTIPVMAFSMPRSLAFYPDGAWWLPCLMGRKTQVLEAADKLGIDESFCPVRAMLGAFELQKNFPMPDIITCSSGAVCDDFSAIAQRLESRGHRILWWEMPLRRKPEKGEKSLPLPGGLRAPSAQLEFVKKELERIRRAFSELRGHPLSDAMISRGIRAANKVRKTLSELRQIVFSAKECPLPALEMLIAEMLIIHFCSDLGEAGAVLNELLGEAKKRVRSSQCVLRGGEAKIFWVNPVSDIKVMNLLEDCGGRLCGTENMFCHALEIIPEDMPPIDALARSALADPMTGSSAERAEKICRDAAGFGAEALIIARIPGASHCATEGGVIRRKVETSLGIPAIELEVPPVSDGDENSLRTRISALVETVERKRQ